MALAVVDTLWALPLSLEGDGRAVPVLSAAMAENPPPPGPGPVGRAVREWLSGSTFLGDFVRLSDGRWLVNTWRQREGGVLWGLILLSSSGEHLWELPDAPRLLEVDTQDRLYFWDPQGLEPGMIRIAEMQ
jgi:hypothetical protein